MSFFIDGAEAAAHAGGEWTDAFGHAAHHLDVLHDAGHAADAADAIHPDLVQAASHFAPAEGNAEELLSCQDPLLHAAEYVPAAFLEAHGLDHVPPGYEIHHIIPLSEGGADDPSNMILLTAEDHAAITAQHAAYYHWQAHTNPDPALTGENPYDTI